VWPAAAALLVLGDGGALAQPLPGFAATYLCEGAAVLRVAYINPAEAAGYAVIDWQGRLIPMRQVPAASGVWYVAFDEQDGHRWRTRGDEAFLAHLAPDHTATEQVILAGCRRVD
jgi:membrane-bound inhibitor of C-type lysozyme